MVGSKHHDPIYTVVNRFSLSTLLLLLLIVLPEVSISTSLAIHKQSWHSIYLARIGFFTYADLVIFVLVGILLFDSCFRRESLPIGQFSFLIIFYAIYLILGSFFNSYLQFSIKAFLYDCKSILYFVIPYFLMIKASKKILLHISSEKLILYCLWAIFIATFISSGIDKFIVSILDLRSEYPTEFFGIPLLLNPVSAPICMSILLLEKRKMFFGLALLGTFYSLVCAYGMVKLGLVFQFGNFFLFCIFIFFLDFLRLKGLRCWIILYWFAVCSIQIFLIFDIFSILDGVKSSGRNIRLDEIRSFIDNIGYYFSPLLGQGFGATWLQTSQDGATSIYATGSVFSEGSIRFIWHNVLGGVFFKAGVIAPFVILFLSIQQIEKFGYETGSTKLMFVCMAVFLIECFPVIVGPGELKVGVFAGMFLGCISGCLSYGKEQNSVCELSKSPVPIVR